MVFEGDDDLRSNMQGVTSLVDTIIRDVSLQPNNPPAAWVVAYDVWSANLAPECHVHGQVLSSDEFGACCARFLSTNYGQAFSRDVVFDEDGHVVASRVIVEYGPAEPSETHMHDWTNTRARTHIHSH